MSPAEKDAFEEWFVQQFPAQYFAEWTDKIKKADALYRFGQAVLKVCKLAYEAGIKRGATL